MDAWFLIPFIFDIGAGWGMDTRMPLQIFLLGMRDYFRDAEKGTSMYKIFLIGLLPFQWLRFNS